MNATLRQPADMTAESKVTNMNSRTDLPFWAAHIARRQEFAATDDYERQWLAFENAAV